MLLTGTDTADPLRARMQGDLVLRSEPGFDDARLGFNLVADLRPAMVAHPACAEDVREIVAFAARHGLRVLVQTTGHSAAPLGDLSDVILVRTGAMRGVTIDPGRRTARVEAGAVWGDVTGPASEHGLAPVSGSSPGVGVVGFTTGGGLGWLGRSHGLGCQRVLAFEVVTADGRLVRADADTEPDLFWALRGGGGSFAAITALEIELVAVPELHAGMMLWPWERAGEVLQAWRAFTESAPETATTAARIIRLPPLPALPPFLRGRDIVVIDGALQTDAARAAALLAPLRALGPEMDTFAPVPPAALPQIHMDPEDPAPVLNDHALLEVLPAEAVDALVAGFGPDSDSPLTVLELRHLGGALGRPGDAALSHLPAEYLLFGVGIPVDQAAGAALELAFAGMRDIAAPWASARGYANFAERGQDTATLLGADAARRVREIRAAVDPDGLFAGAHAASSR
jgi:FAD/FMN-containing dehydrogenase